MNATPAKWFVNFTKFDGAITRWHIASDKHGSVYPICEHVMEQGQEAQEQIDNAAMISAAPELAEALDIALEYLSNVKIDNVDRNKMKDALRKALNK